MVNFRVADLDGIVRQLEKEGRFAWIMDPEGNRIELWEPKATKD